ncbi:hypothetical protein HYALB_00003764 [Hymenoscyphus albidus]|uniref:Uncharacterized protein n=1 Tax=Hymenoscyphus albidus TaxID=595503 RepID=A0A9N9Q5S9_9HELO|nr:hypothetical protein HYALB_00003764 [Hymenoscyphus albidus]
MQFAQPFTQMNSLITTFEIIWAIATACSFSTFSRVIALANKPLGKDAFLLQGDESQKLDVYDGIDLTSGVENVIRKLQEIDGI